MSEVRLTKAEVYTVEAPGAPGIAEQFGVFTTPEEASARARETLRRRPELDGSLFISRRLVDVAEPVLAVQEEGAGR